MYSYITILSFLYFPSSTAVKFILSGINTCARTGLLPCLNVKEHISDVYDWQKPSSTMLWLTEVKHNALIRHFIGVCDTFIKGPTTLVRREQFQSKLVSLRICNIPGFSPGAERNSRTEFSDKPCPVESCVGTALKKTVSLELWIVKKYS